jgi:hypothetical protein
VRDTETQIDLISLFSFLESRLKSRKTRKEEIEYGQIIQTNVKKRSQKLENKREIRLERLREKLSCIHRK